MKRLLSLLALSAFVSAAFADVDPIRVPPTRPATPEPAAAAATPAPAAGSATAAPAATPDANAPASGKKTPKKHTKAHHTKKTKEKPSGT